MKFVVISDIHGRADLAERAVRLHPDRDGVLFLGDGARDITEVLTERGAFGGVRGNCDVFRGADIDLSEELFLCLSEYNVIMMHGHTHSVKSGDERAAVYASRRGADILLYGHTHVPIEKYYPSGTEIDGYVLPKPLWVMNPGSVHGGSFGLLQIKGGQVLMSHGCL